MGPAQTKILVESMNKIYRERITEILGRNSARLTNIMNVSQDIELVINCDEGCKICTGSGGLQITQSQAGTIRFVTNVTQAQVNDIVSMVETDLSNKTSQTYRSVSELLSNLGAWTSTDVQTRILNQVKDIVRNEITLENIVNILNSVQLGQNNRMTWNLGRNTEIGGKQCIIRQDIFIDFFSESLIDMVVRNATEDSSITRMLADARQDTQIEAKGLDSVIRSAFTGIAGMAVGGIVILIVLSRMQSSVVPSDSLTEAAKKRPGLAILAVFVVILIVLAIVYMPVAKLFSLWPFSGERKLWKCEVVDGMHTGKCVLGVFEKGFRSREECEQSKTCDQNWGCQFAGGVPTGKCAQYASSALGPYRSERDCADAVAQGKTCTLKWGPVVTDAGVYAVPPRCQQFQDPKLGRYRTEGECLENKDKFRNKWKCSAGACAEVHPSNEWAMYTTEADCRANCRSTL